MAITDSNEYLPPLSGTYAYNTFKPGAAGFPAKGAIYVDPIFGETVRRMSDIGATVDDNQQYGFPIGNADGTLIFHWTFAGSLDVLRASDATLVYSGIPEGIGSRTEMRWSHVDPDVYFYFLGQSIRKHTLSTGADVIYHDFGVTLLASGNDYMGGSVITHSRDDRYFLVRYSDTGHVWDSQTNIVYTGNVPLFGGGGYFGLTPDAKYVVGGSYGTRAGFGSRLKSFAIDHVAHTVNTVGVDYWNIGGAHATFVSASNGNNYAIVEDSLDTTALYAVDIVTDRSTMSAANQKAGATLLLQLDPFTDQFHMCAVVNGPFQDWAFISTERTGTTDNFNTTPTGATWFPFNQEIIAVNPVTAAHRRLAHHRSRGDFGNNAVYQAQPRASGSVKGDLVAFTSNMNISSPNNYADLYLIPNPLGAATPTPVTGTIAATQANQTTAIRGWTTTLFNFATTQANNTAAFVFKKSYNIALAGSQSDNTGTFTALFGMPQPKGTMAATSLVSGLWGGKIHGSFVRVGNNFDWVATQDDNAAAVAVTIGIKGDMAGHEIVSGLWGGRLHSEFGYKGVTYSFAIAATQGNATAALTLEEAEYFALTTTQANNTVAITADATTLFQFDITQADNTAAWEYVPNASIFFSIEPTESGATADFGMTSDATPERPHHGGDDEKGEHDEHDYMKTLKQQFKRKQEKSVLAVIAKFLETVE